MCSIIIKHMHQILKVMKMVKILKSNCKQNFHVQHKCLLWLVWIQSSAVVTRSNVIWFCIHHCTYWGRIWIKVWTHKRHPIPGPNGWGMGCLLLGFSRKLTNVITAPRCIFFLSVYPMNYVREWCFNMFCCFGVIVSFIHILEGYLTDTGTIKCLWSNPEEYELISHRNPLGTMTQLKHRTIKPCAYSMEHTIYWWLSTRPR